MRPALFVFDTETALIQPGLLAPPAVCLQWREDRTGAAGGLTDQTDVHIVSAREGVDVLAAALADPTLKLVGHNVCYDFGVMCALEPDLVRPVFEAYAAGRVADTRVREKLLKLSLGQLASEGGFASGAARQAKFDMAEIVRRRWRVDISADKDNPKSWRKRYVELIDLPIELWPEDAVRYACEDISRTHHIYREQEGDLHTGIVRPDGSIVDETRKVATAWAAHLGACWGVRTDPTKVYALRNDLQTRVTAVTDALYAAGLYKIDRKTGKYAKKMSVLTDWVTAAYAPAPAPLTETNRVSTSKDVLVQAPVERQVRVQVRRGTEVTAEPALLALASISAAQHNMDTYIPAFDWGMHTPINYGFNELLESGRTSYYKPNFQNLPRKGGFRECIVPRPGWLFINADYSTVELAALAQVCLDLFGFSEMAAAIQRGEDLHVAMGVELINAERGTVYTYAEGATMYAAGDPTMIEARQMAKAVNFGFPGGLGAATLIVWARSTYGVAFGATEQEAEARVRNIKRRWLAKWPEMVQFFAYVSALVEAGAGSGVVVQPRSGRVRGGVGYCDGCNTFFQGLAADGATLAWFWLQQEGYTGYSEIWPDDGREPSPLLGSRITLFIHDEFVGESPADRAAEAAERMAVVMKAAMARYVPDVPVAVSPVLMDRWYKDAKTVRDSSGRLVVWQPK